MTYLLNTERVDVYRMNIPGDCVLKEVELEGLGVYWNFGHASEEGQEQEVSEWEGTGTGGKWGGK